jgi:hypothetical protein
MDLNEYIDFIIVAEELDKLGRYAESDNLVRLAQFPSMNPQGFGGFGNMGAGNGNFYTPQMQGAAIGGALGNAAFKSPVGTAIGTLIGSELGRKQGNDIQQRNIPAEQKILKMKEELIKLQNQNPSNPSKITDLQKKIEEEETILKQTTALRAQNQPQPSLQTGSQTGLPASASLDQLKAYNAAKDAKSFDELQKSVANFTLAEQALAFRFWNLKSQQAATQTPGQPATQMQAGQLPPAVNNILMGMLYDKTMTTQQDIWTKISSDALIPAELKRAAFDEFLKLRSNQIYGAQQAQAQPPVAAAQFTPEQETQISNVVNAAMNAKQGQKFNYIKKLRLNEKITQPIYDEAIKRLKEKVTLLQSMRPK